MNKRIAPLIGFTLLWYLCLLPFIGAFVLFLFKYARLQERSATEVIGGAFVAAIFSVIFTIVLWLVVAIFLSIVTIPLYSRDMLRTFLAVHGVVVFLVPWPFVLNDSYLLDEIVLVVLLVIILTLLTCCSMFSVWKWSTNVVPVTNENLE